MYNYEELPVKPLLQAEPVRMPINVLLALPQYVTRFNFSLHPFNVPGVINYLMEKAGWERAAKVMRPHVWAPGWSDAQLRKFVTAPFGEKQRIFPSTGLADLRVRRFPGTQGRVNMNDWQTPRYDIVHVLANFVLASSFNLDPALRLEFKGLTIKDDDFIKGRILTAGALRDALVAAKTRLLILQVHSHEESNAQSLARFVVGSGGPAVLVVAGLDAQSLDQYFFSLYADIVHNRFLDQVAQPPSPSVDDALSVNFFYGQGGRELLRFDRWLRELNEHIDRFEALATQANDIAKKTLADVRQYLHSEQARRIEARPFMPEGAPIDFSQENLLLELNQLRSNINYAHESGGAIPLTQIAEKMAQVYGLTATLESNYPKLHEMLAVDANEEALRAPRVLNAGFIDPHTRQPLPAKQALVAAQEYDMMVDVGPRWKEFQSLVTGNAEFPEEFLPPNQDGYLVKVVLLSEDFQAVDGAPTGTGAGAEEASPVGKPAGELFEVVDIKPQTEDASAVTSFRDEFRHCVLSQFIWVPRDTGPSFPVINGVRAENPGPVLLRLRAPDFPTGSDEPFTMARARLCLYYQNNLLQSARVSVSIARTPDHVTLDVANEIGVDYVLTGSFQDIGQYATRTLLSETGEATNSTVGLNLTLNDDGAGEHRIIVEHHEELTVWRPYDPAAAKGTLDRTRTKLKNCFWLKNPTTCDIDEADETKRKDGLQADNGKTLRQFQCDLFWLAQNGADLYIDMLGQLNRPDLIQWAARLSQALATKTVIQVARTSLAQYVFPWALIYDIPLPDRNIPNALRWCEVLKKEWSDPKGRRTLPPRDFCEFQDRPEHQKNTLCPYGFWGLKHFIEQPINLQPKTAGTDSNPTLPSDAYIKITHGATLDLAVGMTRDTSLDTARLDTHLATLQNIAAYMPAKGADDWAKVQAMLQAPGLVYFLCHGEYDVTRDEPYLGVGLRDDNFAHRIYPKDLTAWALTQGATFWQNRNPLIFINGCHTSNLRPGEILNFVTTFANFGASGVIGTEVSIRLPLAIEIAEELLRQIMASASVGMAMRQIRWELVNKGNLLGLAYTPYCMSSLHMERAGQ